MKKSKRHLKTEEHLNNSDCVEEITALEKQKKVMKGPCISSQSDSKVKAVLKKSKKPLKMSQISEESDQSGSEDELDPEKHKESLEKLKKIDPDFYSFLEENDENLLNFEGDSDEQGGSGDDDDDAVHKPGPLQGDSDESDFEDGESKPAKGKITLKQVALWQEELQSETKVKLTTLTTVIKAFNAAMLRATSEDGSSEGDMKVEGSSVFNAVIQMCVLYLPAAIKKYLGMEQSGKDPQKCKHFIKIKGPLVAYLNDLLKLLGGVTSENILTVLLKHLHQMSVYIACFSRIAKHSLKKLITFWSTGDETVRVLAFLCILRITRNQQATLLDLVLKAMYLTYVKNCKFVSPTTWPGINFMRRSLVEMFSLDLNVSYQHVFLYIRQLAILLRTAIVVQKVENRQAVYNWQFVNSLHLWADLLGASSNKPQLQPLVYPLTMVITNTVKLVPTHQYFPLRFHCVEILMNLSKETNTFIPILPFLIEVVSFDWNKRHKKVSMKPLDVSCMLRAGKAQLAENGFKDAAVERLYALLLEYAANISHCSAFPDICLLAVLQIKQFLKTCSVANYTKKLRQLLEKIEENAKFIERERSKVSFALSDSKMITAWETSIKTKGTPLLIFFENWNKINKIQKRKKISKNDEIAGELPMIKRPKITDEITNPKPERKGPLVLFPSDDEDEKDDKDPFNMGDEEEEQPKVKKVKKVKQKNSAKKKALKDIENDVADNGDVVQDFSVSDW